MADKKPKKKFTETADPNYSASSTEVLKQLGVEEDEWDVMLVGDGSGTTWNSPCGWASILIDKELGLRKTMFGAMNAGTSYLAELVPYVQALAWYTEGPGKARLADLRLVHPHAKLKVHVVTDNATVAAQGQGRASRRKGAFYWSMIESLEENGYAIYWHWKGRSEIGLNRLCDYLAGESRRSLLALAPIEPPSKTTAYDYNSDPVPKESAADSEAAAPPDPAVPGAP